MKSRRDFLKNFENFYAIILTKQNNGRPDVLSRMLEIRERQFAAADLGARVYAGTNDAEKAFEWGKSLRGARRRTEVFYSIG